MRLFFFFKGLTNLASLRFDSCNATLNIVTSVKCSMYVFMYVYFHVILVTVADAHNYFRAV